MNHVNEPLRWETGETGGPVGGVVVGGVESLRGLGSVGGRLRERAVIHDQLG